VDSEGQTVALETLRAMARGGTYDVVGGGFARYSTDDLWRVPHFEKMLYDNAQLALSYLHAFLLTQDAFFRDVAVRTLDFVVREMGHPDGGFFSSLDDSRARKAGSTPGPRPSKSFPSADYDLFLRLRIRRTATGGLHCPAACAR
jgi:uncharacterized protein YyaL (SSP411 family)